MALGTSAVVRRPCVCFPERVSLALGIDLPALVAALTPASFQSLPCSFLPQMSLNSLEQ